MKPVLFLDVDGVISREDCEPNCFVPQPQLGQGMVKPASLPDTIRTGLQIRQLMTTFEIVWATAWEDYERDPLLDMLGIEQRFPSIEYRTHKLLCILEYVEEHGIEHWVWIDDYATTEVAGVSVAPHLLTGLIVAPIRTIGLEDRHVTAALEWVAQRREN